MVSRRGEVLHTRMQRLYRVAAYSYETTVQSLALHTCVSAATSIIVLVSAAISIIVLFVATLRLCPVLETRDDLAIDNGQNRPLARSMGDAGRPLVR